ncbi:hypothetical protein BKA70DRAFT_1278902 [Coprinopsis sp. MPI-PUGE-AT-0042]|nr:hypothetical protein BKA70DRAFT_1278902 [Coprinopsis sp. MPI-PUGE-AT-0042]
MASKMRILFESGDAGCPPQNIIPYTRILTILIESALPFTLFGIVCAILSQILASKAQDLGALSAYQIVLPLWIISCGLAPMLIIFRVVARESWVSDPTLQRDTRMPTICFATRNTVGSVTIGVEEAKDNVERGS